MKATELLRQQHRAVEALFAEIEGGGDDVPGLVEQLANDLACHMAIEQNLFYPAVHDCDDDLVEESFEEHAMAEVALRRLVRVGPDDPTFEAKLGALKGLIEHHVLEEEQQLLPAVEKALSPEQLEWLGARLQGAFEEAQTEGFSALVPESMSWTSADQARKVAQIRREPGATLPSAR